MIDCWFVRHPKNCSIVGLFQPVLSVCDVEPDRPGRRHDIADRLFLGVGVRQASEAKR